MSAIVVDGVSKRYLIGHQQHHDTLRDTLTHGVRGLFSRLTTRRVATRHEEFWALRDVSFAVQPGEVMGIIGRNGAGKSTLLKILSRITESTTGRVRLRGRVASLLEVGTGFHPELTGRENIFLNGAILGMTRSEIRRQFDEIVAFAEIERFLDTPVKRYSSGMYVRLAFAVAAHLEPEILIVDEVLAVGDAAFQKKCLGKMQSVSRTQGRTVLFVSHNLGTVQSLCSRCVLLHEGRVVCIADSGKAVADYLRIGMNASSRGEFTSGDPALRIDETLLLGESGTPKLQVTLTVRSSIERSLAIEFILSTITGVPVAFAGLGTLDEARRTQLRAGETSLRATIDLGSLANGSYQLITQLVEPMVHIWARHEHASFIEVNRAARAPRHRVLQQQWHAGYVELDMDVAPL